MASDFSFTFAIMLVFFNHFLLLIFSLFLLVSSAYSQDIAFTNDTLKSYMIVTLKDGTVLKGKISNKAKRTIQFQDEMLGNISFRAKDVTSMEKVEPQDYYLITMMNGTTLQGKIVDRQEKGIVVETSSIGNIIIDVDKIKTIKNINPGNMKDGKYWFKSPVDAHYFISPSSIPLKSNEAYYQNSMLLFNSFEAGITNHFSCAGGAFIPTAAFVAPHFGYRIGNGIHAGGGALFSVRTGKLTAGIAYGTITFGNRNTHLSVGGGYGYFKFQRYYYRNKIETAYITAFTISGMKRLSPKYALVTENWFASDNGFGIFTGGLRLMGEKHSWDFGIGSISVSRKIAGNSISLGPITFLSYMRNL